ncbi:MAG TPA: hypothetical protein VFP22_00095, partial [Candidatus Limnocylindrales bacterium]|nr:hypothetical protein [Candidatus Limnocylindrales bacterium]
AVARANVELLGQPLGLFGHTHVPAAWLERDGRLEGLDPRPGIPVALDGATRALVNPGSVGQPRDGDPRASWLELDLEARTATWHRVPYDVPAVQRAMREAGLPARLADRLRHGL